MPSITGDDKMLGTQTLDSRFPGAIGFDDIQPDHGFERLEEVAIARLRNSGLKIFTGSQRDNCPGGRQFIDDFYGNTRDRRICCLQADRNRLRGFFDCLLHAAEHAENNPRTNKFQGVLTHPPFYEQRICQRYPRAKGLSWLICLCRPGFSVAASQN